MKSKNFMMAVVVSCSCFLLCSFAPGSIELEWHAFTKDVKILDESGNNVEDQQINAGGVGHSYVVIKNHTSSSLTVGHCLLSPNNSVSVGLWVLSSSSSSSGSSQSSGGYSHRGVVYNLERCKYTIEQRPCDEVYVVTTLSSSTLNSISQKILDKNDDYNLTTYNCATFSTEIWNLATGSTYWTGWFRTPANVRNQITNEFSEYYSSNYSLATANNFFYFDKTAEAVITCYLG
jgi:hypothetical protein